MLVEVPEGFEDMFIAKIKKEPNISSASKNGIAVLH